MNTTLTNGSTFTEAQYAPTLLEYVTPRLVYCGHGTKATVMAGHGTSITWDRLVRLTPSTTALVEGVPPVPDDITFEQVVGNVAQYGRWYEVTDVQHKTQRHSIWNKGKQVMTQVLKETYDTLCREAMYAATSIVYAGAATSLGTLASTDVLTTTTLETLFKALFDANAPTYPNGRYRFLITSKQMAEIKADTTYRTFNLTALQDARQAMQSGGLVPYEGFDFIVGTNRKTGVAGGGAGTPDAQIGFAFGPDWIAELGLENGDLIVTTIGFEPTKDDPLGQKAVYGWQMWYGAKVLDENRGRIVISA